MGSRTILLAEEDPATAGLLADNLIADDGRRARGARAMGS